jgi:hypothetical protein
LGSRFLSVCVASWPRISLACFGAVPCCACTSDGRTTEVLCFLPDSPFLPETREPFHDGRLEALSDHSLRFRRTHMHLSISVQCSASLYSSRRYRRLLLLVYQICVSQGVSGFAVVLSRFRHKRISPLVVRTLNRFQPFRSGSKSLWRYIRLSNYYSRFKRTHI